MASSRPAAVADIVLSQPVMEGDLDDAEVQCGLLGPAALADQSEGTGTELRRVMTLVVIPQLCSSEFPRLGRSVA